jgi:hypothetical protein
MEARLTVQTIFMPACQYRGTNSPEEKNMNPRFVRDCLGCTAIIILTACSGTTPPTLTQAPGASSFMKSAASKNQLLYVSDTGNFTVGVFDYPMNKLSQTLSGLEDVAGECRDAAGHVFIVAEGKRETDEYAPGGTSPIAKFKEPGPGLSWPNSCAVDPTTGNLAVANIISGTGKVPGPGSVSVFTPGQKGARKYRISSMYTYWFVGYDGSGNLFVDGSASRAAIEFRYAELAKGQTEMTPITLVGGSIATPGNVQWDGKHIAIGDQANAVIYQTKGAKIVGSTPLTGSSDCVGFFIDRGTVICPDAGNKAVEFYNYPAGGSPTGSITGFDKPVGAVVTN